MIVSRWERYDTKGQVPLVSFLFSFCALPILRSIFCIG